LILKIFDEKSGENFLQKNAKNCKICDEKKILKNKISGENLKNIFAEIWNFLEKNNFEKKICAKKIAEKFWEISEKNLF